MFGMIGVGLGLAVGIAATRDGGPVGFIWPILGVAFFLVYRWGRRHGSGASAVAVAVAEATAISDSASVSSAAVQVFIASGPNDARLDKLQGVTWRDADASIDRQISRDSDRAIEQDGYDGQVLDELGADEVIDRVRRGVPAAESIGG